MQQFIPVIDVLKQQAVWQYLYLLVLETEILSAILFGSGPISSRELYLVPVVRGIKCFLGFINACHLDESKTEG